jgi:hypothetical protein
MSLNMAAGIETINMLANTCEGSQKVQKYFKS